MNEVVSKAAFELLGLELSKETEGLSVGSEVSAEGKRVAFRLSVIAQLPLTITDHPFEDLAHEFLVWLTRLKFIFHEVPESFVSFLRVLFEFSQVQILFDFLFRQGFSSNRDDGFVRQEIENTLFLICNSFSMPEFFDSWAKFLSESDLETKKKILNLNGASIILVAASLGEDQLLAKVVCRAVEDCGVDELNLNEPLWVDIYQKAFIASNSFFVELASSALSDGVLSKISPISASASEDRSEGQSQVGGEVLGAAGGLGEFQELYELLALLDSVNSQRGEYIEWINRLRVIFNSSSEAIEFLKAGVQDIHKRVKSGAKMHPRFIAPSLVRFPDSTDRHLSRSRSFLGVIDCVMHFALPVGDDPIDYSAWRQLLIKEPSAAYRLSAARQVNDYILRNQLSFPGSLMELDQLIISSCSEGMDDMLVSELQQMLADESCGVVSEPSSLPMMVSSSFLEGQEVNPSFWLIRTTNALPFDYSNSGYLKGGVYTYNDRIPRRVDAFVPSGFNFEDCSLGFRVAFDGSWGEAECDLEVKVDQTGLSSERYLEQYKQIAVCRFKVMRHFNVVSLPWHLSRERRSMPDHERVSRILSARNFDEVFCVFKTNLGDIVQNYHSDLDDLNRYTRFKISNCRGYDGVKDGVESVYEFINWVNKTLDENGGLASDVEMSSLKIAPVGKYFLG